MHNKAIIIILKGNVTHYLLGDFIKPNLFYITIKKEKEELTCKSQKMQQLLS